MNKELRHAIHQLKGKSFPDSLLSIFYRESKEAYSLLHDGVSARKFTPIQTRNALVVMYNLCRQHCVDERSEFFDLTFKFSANSDLVVRSQAAIILANIVRLVDEEVWPRNLKRYNRSRALKGLQRALHLTLSREATAYVKSFCSSVDDDESASRDD